jgi:copper transport protein
VAAVTALALPSGASAHAYLLSVQPQDRSVIAVAPRNVVLTFDQAILPASGIEAIRNGGGSVLGGKAQVNGRTLVIPLKSGLQRGAYTVRWRAISQDGHLEGGVIAFGVGTGIGPPTPALSAGSTTPGPGQIAARWVFFIGLLVAAGAAVFQILIWRIGLPDAELTREERRRVDARELRAGSIMLLAGFAAAILGALLLLLLTGAGSNTRFGRVLDIGLVLAGVGAVASLAALKLRVVRPAALAAALAVLPVPSLAGHALDPGQSRLDLVVDIGHVTASAVWLGGLLTLVVVLPWAGRVLTPQVRERLLLPLARRFSTLAFAAVVMLAATGVGRALAELGAVSELWTTSYGVTLIVKTALLAVLLGFAARNRVFLLDGPFARLRLGVAAESAVLLGLIVAVAVLTGLPPGRTAAAATAAKRAITATRPPRLPPSGSVVLAKEDGRYAVALAATPAGSGRLQLTATVLSPDNTGVNGLRVTFGARGTKATSQGPGYVCGSGCYTAVSPGIGRPVAATVTIIGQGASSVQFAFPARWPAPSAAQLVRRASARYRALRSVSYVERLKSAPGIRVVSAWKEIAPNRLEYRIPGGPAGIAIGTKRWDRTTPTGRWIPSSTQVILVPQPIWGTRAFDAHLLGQDKRTYTVSFLNRSLPAWFTVRFDRKTLHPLSLEMTAAAHFMHHDYTSFDRKLVIKAPGGAQ